MVSVESPLTAAASSSDSSDLAVPGSPTSIRPRLVARVTIARSTSDGSPTNLRRMPVASSPRTNRRAALQAQRPAGRPLGRCRRRAAAPARRRGDLGRRPLQPVPPARGGARPPGCGSRRPRPAHAVTSVRSRMISDAATGSRAPNDAGRSGAQRSLVAPTQISSSFCSGNSLTHADRDARVERRATTPDRRRAAARSTQPWTPASCGARRGASRGVSRPSTLPRRHRDAREPVQPVAGALLVGQRVHVAAELRERLQDLVVGEHLRPQAAERVGQLAAGGRRPTVASSRQRRTASSSASAKLRSSATRKAPTSAPSLVEAPQTRRRTTCHSSGCSTKSWRNSAPVQRRRVTIASSSRRIWSAAIVRTSFFSAGEPLVGGLAPASASSLAPGFGRSLTALAGRVRARTA